MCYRWRPVVSPLRLFVVLTRSYVPPSRNARANSGVITCLVVLGLSAAQVLARLRELHPLIENISTVGNNIPELNNHYLGLLFEKRTNPDLKSLVGDICTILNSQVDTGAAEVVYSEADFECGSDVVCAGYASTAVVADVQRCQPDYWSTMDFLATC